MWYVRMYVCMQLCMYICIYTMYVCICVCMYVCTYVCMYECMCLCVCMYVCMYVLMYVCTVFIGSNLQRVSKQKHQMSACWQTNKTPTIYFLSTSPYNVTPDHSRSFCHSHTHTHTHNSRGSRAIDQVCKLFVLSYCLCLMNCVSQHVHTVT